MRAIMYDTFGSPDVLSRREVALLEPGPGQVRAAIFAAGTNLIDAQNRQDGSWADLHPPVIPGCDASGVIDAVGPAVGGLAPGDEVFYMVDFLHNVNGTYADFQVVDTALIARKPQSLTHVEAAVLPLAADTAYEMIIRHLALTRGETEALPCGPLVCKGLRRHLEIRNQVGEPGENGFAIMQAFS